LSGAVTKTKQTSDVAVLWIVVPCSLMDGNQRFGGRAASIFRAKF